MEEAIGYETLFSAEEWDSVSLRHEPKRSVTIWYPPGEAAGNENSYEDECAICKTFGAAESEDEADVMPHLHEIFRAREVGE